MEQWMNVASAPPQAYVAPPPIAMGGVMIRKECVESMYGDIFEIEILTV